MEKDLNIKLTSNNCKWNGQQVTCKLISGYVPGYGLEGIYSIFGNNPTAEAYAIGTRSSGMLRFDIDFSNGIYANKIIFTALKQQNAKKVYINFILVDGSNVEYDITNELKYNNKVTITKTFTNRLNIKTISLKHDMGTTVSENAFVIFYQDMRLFLTEFKSLITSKTPINLLDKSKVKGFTIAGIQPTNTNRKVAFKVDNKWNKLTTEGALSPLPTQAITSDSVLAEGNTVTELTALTNVPSLVGKLVYPAFALYADSNATVMPTIGMTVKAEIDTTVDVYTKTDYSQEFVLHNSRDVLVKSISVDSNIKGNGKVTLKARYATFDETAITEEGAEQTEKWSDYVDFLSVINVKCHKLQIKADYQVSITDGSDSATLNDVIITYAKDVVAKADGTTDLVTLTEKFTNDLTYVHAYIKHKELIDADLKAYVRLQKTPKKAEFKLIGYGIGARKTYKVTDKGINQDSLMVYVNGKAVYDFDFNTETSEITLVADVDVPINATYEFGWELFNYVEMQKDVSQINDSGAYTTEYSYTVPTHKDEYTVTAIKYELLRPEGHVDNDVIGVGTGKRQIIQLPHYARKETISCNGKWSYDYDSKRLTVIAPKGDNIVISYDWIAESPQVYGVMAGWAD